MKNNDLRKILVLGIVFTSSLMGCGGRKETFTTKPSGKEVTKEEFLEAAKNCKYANEYYGKEYFGKATITGFYNFSASHPDERYAEDDRVEAYEGSITYDFTHNEIVESSFSTFVNDSWGKEITGPEETKLVLAANVFTNCSSGMWGIRTIYQLNLLVNGAEYPDYRYYLKPAQIYYLDDISEGLFSFNKDGLVIKTAYQEEDKEIIQYDFGNIEVDYKCTYQFSVTYL